MWPCLLLFCAVDFNFLLHQYYLFLEPNDELLIYFDIKPGPLMNQQNVYEQCGSGCFAHLVVAQDLDQWWAASNIRTSISIHIMSISSQDVLKYLSCTWGYCLATSIVQTPVPVSYSLEYMVNFEWCEFYLTFHYQTQRRVLNIQAIEVLVRILPQMNRCLIGLVLVHRRKICIRQKLI